MIRKILTACVASAALAIAGPALAGPGGGGGHGGNGGGVGGGASANGGMHGGGLGNGGAGNAGANGSMSGNLGSFVNPAAGVSQGPANASITGITNANSHSVLASGAVSGSTLGDLQGLSVMNSSGMTIGSVSQVVTDRSGNIRLVIVTSPTGQTFRLMPNTLSVSNGVVTTTSNIGG